MITLVRWLLARRLWQERWRTLLTLLGVALGVSVFVSIRLASFSALSSFAETVDAVTGRANLQVQSTSDGFDEALYARLVRWPGVVAAAPIVQVSALAKPGGPIPGGALEFDARGAYTENLMLLGLDPLVEAPFLRYDPATAAQVGAKGGGDPAASMRSALRLLAQPNTVAITRTLANRLRLRLDDTLTVLSSGIPTPLVIAQVIQSEELQQAMGGNVALLDVATAQEVFHRSGRLDRVDLIVAPQDRDRVRRELQQAMPVEVAVDLPQTRTRQVENMVHAFELNLTALSFIALFVSMFLIFNAVAMSVLRWRREVGILRGLGVTRSEVTALFLTEGIVLGVAGSAIGLGIGTVLARGTLHAVGQTLTDLYQVQHANTLRLDPATYGIGFGLGVLAAFLSALLPAIEAAWTPPGVTMRQGILLEAQRLPIKRLTATGVGALFLSAWVAAWTVHRHQPMGGFASAFLVILAFSLLAPGFTLTCERLVSGPAGRLGGIEGALGARYLKEAVARTSVVVASLMLAVGMMVALSIMVGSFRRTVDTWITQTIRGDLYIEPVGHRTSLGATVLPDSLIEAAGRLPGVIAVDTYRATTIRFGDRLAFVVGVDFDVQGRLGKLGFVNGADSRAVLSGALASGAVIVTESFSHRHRVKAGETIELRTPSGPARLRVAGVFYDYSTDAGAVLMDRRLFARLWKDPRTESLALYCSRGADLDSVRRAFVALAGPRRVFSITPNQALRERVLTVFDQTFRITFALQLIAVLVAVLGVVTTLTALILQRGREMGVLRATGAMVGQVRKMVLIESGLLGLIGSLLGCGAGFALALLLVHVINKQFFGWSIRMSVDPWVFVQAVVMMVVASVLAGIGPARSAAKRVAAEAMRVDA
ncbi:MAG: FtsX-like permease family protein [Candidatus Eisenbacteria bacterium]